MCIKMATWLKIKRFLSPDNSLRLFQLIVSIIMTSAVYNWKENGIDYTDLNSSDYDQKDSIGFFHFVSVLSVVFLALIIVYCMISSPQILAAKVDVITSGSLGLLIMTGTSVLAHAISCLGSSQAVMEARLHLHGLQTAVVFGMMLTILLMTSSAMALHHHYRRRDHMMFRDSRSMTDLPDDILT